MDSLAPLDSCGHNARHGIHGFHTMLRTTIRRALRSAFLLSALVFLAACDEELVGDVVPGGSTAPAGGDFLVTDAAVDGLISFSGVAQSLVLEREDGTLTGELLPGNLSIEFLGLRGRSRWIASAGFEPGKYTAVHLRFKPGSYAARSLLGEPLAVAALSDELVARFYAPQTAVADQLVRVQVDLDRAASLAAGASPGELVFDPRGTAQALGPAVEVALDELTARVSARDVGAGSLSVALFADAERSVPLAPADVIVDDATLLVDRSDAIFDQIPLFMTLLVPGLTMLEVHGSLLADGSLRATSLEIEDQDGGAGVTYPVKIEGLVVGL